MRKFYNEPELSVTIFDIKEGIMEPSAVIDDNTPVGNENGGDEIIEPF